MFNLKNILILFVFIFFITLISQPSTFYFESVNVGDVSDKNIFSPKNHRYIDVEATDKLKSEAEEQVQIVYIENDGIYQDISSEFNLFISSLILFKEELASAENEVKKTDTKEITNNLKDIRASKIEKLNNPFNFSTEQIEIFLSLDNTELNKVSEVLLKELKRIFDARVTVDNVESIKTQFKNNNFYYFFTQKVTDILVEKISTSIVPNFTMDMVETEKRKVEASTRVDDVYKVVKKGELVVRIGDVVSEEQYSKLSELGLIKKEFEYLDTIKQMPYFAMILLLFHVYCFHFYKKEFSSLKSYLFLLISISAVVAITSFVKDSFLNYIPLLTLLMIFMVFWGRKFVIFASIVLGLTLSNGDFNVLYIALIIGVALTLTFSRNNKRIDLIFSGILLGAILFGADAIMYFTFEQTLNFNSHFSILLSAIFASIITVGLIPLLENILGLVTSLRLNELSNPNHPLLKRLLSEALGTYTHSLMVANLAEMAAEKVNANGLLVRVGAYFHDVGKLKNPEYFIENSTPETNPHKLIDPKISAHIIREHPIDSVKMCREFKIPEPIIELILSHHGDATLSHLYNPAKSKDESISIDDFKYQTPTPKTKEEGILLLADSTEAYSRVIRNEPKDVIRKKIKEMIFDKVEHGILRDCELTLKDLEIIIETFSNYLVNSNHERISYNSDKILDKS